ncbi:MAG: hypothetical protein P1T08_13710 [Acidimicrobiia bacterium]|nr:hypothetical protein [Acidimicrobiia bacterium]
MGRGTFAIIVAILIVAVGGSFIGGRLSAQEFLTIVGLFMLWAVGVSAYRGIVRLRNRMTPPRARDDE